MTTKEIRLLFYKPDIDGNWVDNGIAGWTRLFNLDAPKELICSHEELWFPDINDFGSIGNFNGDCWTSTMGQIRSKNTVGSGVRVAPAVDILKHPHRWFYAKFWISQFWLNEIRVRIQIELENNKGYDKAMILNFFLPLGIGEKDKWICSEFCNHHLKLDITSGITDKMSPLRTAKTLHNEGYDMFSLDGSLMLEGKE